MAYAQSKHLDHFTQDVFSSWSYEVTDEGTLLGYSYEPYLGSEILFEKAVNFLVECGSIVRIEDDFGPTVFEFGDVSLYQLAEEARNSPFAKADKYGLSWLESALKEVNRKQSQGALDPSHTATIKDQLDEEWAPLEIERDEVLNEAIAASEEALSTIESDNGYSANEPEERDAIVHSAKGTLEALKSGTPSRAQVVSGLLQPFKYLAKKFADTSIGVAAKIAVEALLKWLL
ncbi:MAG: hypothetical protein CML31_11520 [Rhizobiales bacterium]|nr:hypothetical protein [Hyphomicrobiales bacterium]